MKIYAYFQTNDWNVIHKIQQRFNIPQGVTVNGRTCQPFEVKDEDMEMLKETERRGFIRISQCKTK